MYIYIYIFVIMRTYIFICLYIYIYIYIHIITVTQAGLWGVAADYVRVSEILLRFSQATSLHR